MRSQNYSTSFVVDQTPDETFAAQGADQRVRDDEPRRLNPARMRPCAGSGIGTYLGVRSQ